MRCDEAQRALSEANATMSLETMLSTGLRISLREKSRSKRGYRYLWVDAKLTDRSYEGTQPGHVVEFAIDGDEKLDRKQGPYRKLDVKQSNLHTVARTNGTQFRHRCACR